MLAEFGAVLRDVRCHQPALPVVSGLTGKPADLGEPDYWVRQARREVRFADAVATLVAEGTRTMVEIGPDAVLTAAAQELLADTPAVCVPTARRDQDEVSTVLTAAGRLHVRHRCVDWRAFFADAKQIDLPTYAFQREYYWLGDPGADHPVAVAGAAPAELYVPGWEPVTAEPTPPAGDWSVLGDPVLAEALGATACSDLDALRQGTSFVLLPVAAAPGPLPDGARHVTLRVLDVVQRFLTAAHLADARLVVVTRGAASEPVSAAAWGLLRSAQLEHPGRVVLVDLGDGEPGQLTDAVGSALVAGESQVALVGGKPQVPRLTTLTTHIGRPAARPPVAGTVLVTGATGRLGREVARHLVTAHGVRNLLLISRRGGQDDLSDELIQLGAHTADVVACDVADRSSLAELIAGLRRPLTAVVHAAGVVDDAVITSLSAAHVNNVFRSKVDGAVNLHELTADLNLSRFVLFSSATGTLGNVGQGGYAAANAFLDALASHRRALGLPATAVGWGPWRTGGMTSALAEVDRRRLAQSGVVPLSTREGLRLFDAAWNGDEAVVLPLRLNPSVLQAREQPLPPALRDLAGSRTDQTPFAQRLAAMAGEERSRALLDVVRGKVAAVLGHASRNHIDPDAPFATMGFDSLTAVELRNALAASVGVRLPAALVFDHPTPAALAGYLESAVASDGPGPQLPVLAQLDQLEAAVAALDRDGPLRTQVVDRLRALVAAWSTGTDERFFEFLRTEFGTR